MRASLIASSSQLDAVNRGAAAARVAFAEIRYRTCRTASSRAARSPFSGCPNGTPDILIVCLARLIRCAIVASGTMNARAISPVVTRQSRATSVRSPTTVTATGGSNRRTASACRRVLRPLPLGRRHDAGVGRFLALGERLAFSACRFRAQSSVNRRDATVSSQARGFSGTPNFGHCCDAAMTLPAPRPRLPRSRGSGGDRGEHLGGEFPDGAVDARGSGFIVQGSGCGAVRCSQVQRSFCRTNLHREPDARLEPESSTANSGGGPVITCRTSIGMFIGAPPRPAPRMPRRRSHTRARACRRRRSSSRRGTPSSREHAVGDGPAVLPCLDDLGLVRTGQSFGRHQFARFV